MDIFFANPNEVPVPPEKMEIRQLTATPYEDSKRVSIEFEISPFQKRPNIEIRVFNQERQLVSSFSIVEAIENKMSLTIHMREPEPKGEYQVDMELFYSEIDALDEQDESPIKEILLENKEVVASVKTVFQISHE